MSSLLIISLKLYGSTVLVMLNNQSERGNREQGTGRIREQGKEAIFCNNVQNYGLFLMYSNIVLILILGLTQLAYW
jgi:hypothetical protein